MYRHYFLPEQAEPRQPRQLAHAIHEHLSMDFEADALCDVRKLRMLTVVDMFTRECLAIEVGQSLKEEDVVRETFDTLTGGFPTDRATRYLGVELQ